MIFKKSRAFQSAALLRFAPVMAALMPEKSPHA
jgi:hypothetical protein